MKTDQYGTVSLNIDDLFELVYSGKNFSSGDVLLDDETAVSQYNNSIDKNADNLPKLSAYSPPGEFDSKQLFDEANQCDWFIPEDQIHHNLVEMLYGMCETQEQTNRVSQELELFIQHGMLDLLFYLKYLVDTMRQNNIVWGVGRGSSVASYVLFLLGVHKIDSIKYNLDIHEFLK